MSGHYESLGLPPQPSSLSHRWRLGWICILAILASSVLVRWQGLPSTNLLVLDQEPEALAIEILHRVPTYQADSDGWQPRNISLCAIAAWEDDYLDEWLTYHRLMGVQHFYLYDHKNSPATAKVLLPYIERGVVTLHTATYGEALQGDRNTFHRKLLNHCETKYGSKSQWLFHFDVDEFLRFDQVYPLASEPKLLDGGQYQFPLHDYLMQPNLLSSRCLVLTRNGVFTNIGLVNNTAQSVIDTIPYRTAAVKTQGTAKLVTRGTPNGPAASFDGPHICDPMYDKYFAGLANSPNGIRNIQGGIESKDVNPAVDSVIREPLSIGHYLQRSLQDCLDKLDHVDNADNWRISNGGAAMCYRHFVPSTEQLEQKVFESSQYREEVMQRTQKILVLDESIRNSWYGRNAIAIHASLRRGRRPSVANETAAMEAIVRLVY